MRTIRQLDLVKLTGMQPMEVREALYSTECESGRGGKYYKIEDAKKAVSDYILQKCERFQARIDKWQKRLEIVNNL